MGDINVSWIDLGILIAYVVGTRIGFAWYFGSKVSEAQQRQRGAEQYFLAGRKLRWPIIGLSFYVANMSGSTFIALPGSGYAHGIAVYNYEWLPSLILVAFAFFFLPLYLRQRVFTTPQYLECRYDHRTRLMFSGFLIFASIFIDAAGAFFAVGMVVEAMFPALPFWVVTSLIALAAGLYIVTGGLGLVVANDVLQASLIIAGGAVVCVLAFLELPSWESVAETTPPETLSLIRPTSDAQMPWPGLLVGIPVIGFYFWCTNQHIMQRALGAESLDHGRWGALFAASLKLPNLFILILPGVMAAVLYPGLENSDLAFPRLAFELLPVGLRGLMLAALAAAILSSLEAMLNAASTLFTMDFLRSWRPDSSDEQLVKAGRVMTLVFMVVAALWAPVIYRFETLWHYLQSSLSYLTPPVVCVFLFGAFSHRVSATAAVCTLAVGVPAGAVAWLLVEVFEWVRVQYLYACGGAFVANALLLWGISLASPPVGEAASEGLVWTSEDWRRENRHLAEQPAWSHFRYQSLALSLLTVAIVVWWW